MKPLFATLIVAAALTSVIAPAINAQETRERKVVPAVQAVKEPTTSSERTQTAAVAGVPAATVPAEVSDERREAESELKAAVLPYYNNFLRSYPLGPEDVISVEVFDQPRYSRAGIVIPPTGRISYIHIKGGINVAGKTTEQVGEEIRKHYEEYIIDPVVNVTLDKAASAQFSILGDVGQPGVRVMTRRYSLREALALAGGVLATGDKSKITILRAQEGGLVKPMQVDLKKIEKGKAPDEYLAAGDQVLVPGNRLKKFKQVVDLVSVVSVARVLFGGF